MSIPFYILKEESTMKKLWKLERLQKIKSELTNEVIKNIEEAINHFGSHRY